MHGPPLSGPPAGTNGLHTRHERLSIHHFEIPVSQFDRSLLPPHAREVGSGAFKQAVTAYFVQKLVDSGQHAVVAIDDDEIRVVSFPASIDDPLDLVLDMFNSGRIREGVPILESLSRTRKDDPEIFYNLGIAYSELGEYHEAIMRLKRAVDLAPGHANAMVGLGLAYYRLNQSTDAEKYLRKALLLQPGNPYALRNLAGILGSAGRLDEALPMFRAEFAQKAEEKRTFSANRKMREAVQGGLRPDAHAARHPASPRSQIAQPMGC